jgi:competence protein ComEA
MNAREARQTNASRTLARARSVLATLALVIATVAYARPALAQASDSGASARQAAPDAAPASRGVTAVNLNTATADQLEALPGIGPATATRIVEYRQKNGPFKKIEDLMSIKGIGEKSFLKLKPLVTVGPPRPERPTN